jgi:hypothetical protein
MAKLFENLGSNIFKLKEIDFNRGDDDTTPEPDPFKDVSKQISQLRMNKPKGPELRKERYMRIAANVDQSEFEEMMNFLAGLLYDDAKSSGLDDSYEDVYNEIKRAERWEVISSIDKVYNDTGRDGLAKWKVDHDSPWDL